MTIIYSVFGKKNNKLIAKFQELYYENLCNKLKIILRDNYIKNHFKKDFLLKGDISSLINYIFSYGGDDYKKLLLKEIDIYNDPSYMSGEFVFNKGNLIPNTHIRLTCIDNNPYNVFDKHPDKNNQQGYIGYGEKSQTDWSNILSKSFDILRQTDQDFFYEINESINKIIPLGTSNSIHYSGSYKECIGHIYIGYTLDSLFPEVQILEAIIHEYSHNKLNLLMQIDSIILNDKQEIYYSAIRPDARPMYGVFLGYHAFAPTIFILLKAYYKKNIQNNDAILEKLVLYHMKLKHLQKIVHNYALLTTLGVKISHEIDSVIDIIDHIMTKIYIDDDIKNKALQLQENHFIQVKEKYGYLLY